ncbi:DNA transposase [Frankliniella fusca]|uniref:DNA transposase n=1 Tax=Frankliniella fusca TaxID=407009 RepID=A0AAE1HIG1_9NEOP|nr:DNA transposase [Frankliniella fusca]
MVLVADDVGEPEFVVIFDPDSPDELMAEQDPHSSRSVERKDARHRRPKKERVTVSKLLTSCGINPKIASSSVKYLAKTTQSIRADAQKLMVKLERAQRRNGVLKALAKKSSVELINDLLVSPAAKTILEFELKNVRKKPRGRRWTLIDKLRNVSVYRFLYTLLTLPSAKTLQKLISEIIMEPGFHQTVLRTLEKKAARWSAKNRTCVLMFDEVALLKGIYVNSTEVYLDGFENYGHLGRTSRIATHSLVFLIKVPSEVLKQLIFDAIKMCKSIGLNVVSTLSDQGATNRKAISMLRDTCDKGEYEPVYKVDGSTIVHLWDTPHLIKNIRNNLLVHNLKFGSKGQFLAKWSDIIKY